LILLCLEKRISFSFGLQYFISDKIVNAKLKDSFNLKAEYGKYQKGDLITIRYVIPENMESRFLVENK
jgi:hypothetical protein